MRLLWESNGYSNGFGENLRQKSPITMATMSTVQRMNTVSIVMTKGKLRFSGVGFQHQNLRAKYAIQTIIYMSHTFMVHISLNWTERGADDLS